MYNKRSLSKDTKASKAPKSISKPRDIIVDPMGQWKHPGKNTRIPSSNITMKGVPYPVLGVGSNGQKQMMYPGQEYTFPGADYVDEFPQMRKGGGLKSKKFSRDLEATNYLFHESPLFKKPKSKKKKIFHPKAKHYQKGGQTDEWGRPTDSPWYGFNPDTNKFTTSDPWGRKPGDEWYGFNQNTHTWEKGKKASEQKENEEVQRKRYESLYGPIEGKVLDAVGTDEALANLPAATYNTIQQVYGDFGLKRNIPPVDPVLKEMQKKLLSLPEADIQKLLNTKWTGMAGLANLATELPDNVSYKELYRYYNHINKLKKQGYTLQTGGIPYNYNPFVSNEPEFQETPMPFNPIRTANDPEDYNQFLNYSNTAPENRRPTEGYTYGDSNDYDHYGMWDALGKPKDFQQALQMNPWWEPDPYDHMYHGFSVNPNTGVFLKSGKPGLKPGDTTWMEIAGHYQGRDAQKYTPVFNPDINRFQYNLNDDYIETELTPEEIQQYRDGGYIVEELPKAQNGITYVDDLNDPALLEYKERLKLYNEALRKKQEWLAMMKKYNINTGFHNDPRHTGYRHSGFYNEPEDPKGYPSWYEQYFGYTPAYVPDYHTRWNDAHGNMEYDSSGKRYYVWPNNVAETQWSKRIYNEDDYYKMLQGYYMYNKPKEVRYRPKEETPKEETPVVEIPKEEIPVVETPVVETPKKPVLKPEPELDPQPEMVWIKQYHQGPRNMFGNVLNKTRTKDHWEEIQVPANSPEALRWQQKLEYARGNNPNTPLGIFTNPDAQQAEQKLVIQRQGGQTLPKAQTGKTFGMAQGNYGDIYYVHPDRPDSVYVKRDGKWHIRNSSTDFYFQPIKDPKGERAKNLNKNAVKATPFQLARLDNLSPYENQRQRQHVANVAGGMDPKKSEKQLRSSLEKDTFDTWFGTKDQTWMHPRDASNATELYNKALDFHKGWMNSPMYKKMLANSISKSESKIGEQRIRNFETIPGLLFNKQPEDKPYSGGFSANDNGQIVVLPYGAGVSDVSAHEISHSIDRPDYNVSENRLIPQADINYIQNATPAFNNTPRWKDFDADWQQQVLNDPEHLQEEKDWINYVSEPTEVRARLNAIRATAKESGTYDPYTQEVTPEIYDMLQKMSFGTDEKEGFNPIQQLKDIYSDEQIMEMLNTISKNDNSAGDQLNMAKKGGSLLTKKVTCKKCGWKWDAADGGDDITTCHKCGGKGLVHAKTGGITVGQEIDLTPEQESYLRKLGYKLERIK